MAIEGSHCRVSAVNRKVYAGNISRLFRSKEECSCVELAFLTIALFRDHGLGILLEEIAVECVTGQVCVEVTRADSLVSRFYVLKHRRSGVHSEGCR